MKDANRGFIQFQNIDNWSMQDLQVHFQQLEKRSN